MQGITEQQFRSLAQVEDPQRESGVGASGKIFIFGFMELGTFMLNKK